MEEKVEAVVEETKVETKNTQEGVAKSFHEVVAENKDYQRELDKTIAKAIETAKSKWEKEAEVKRTEAEKLAKMDADEKHKYELEKATKEKEEALSKLNAYELKEEAIKIASGKGLPISLLNVIDYTKENAESIKTKIEEIEVVYKQALQEGINDRMKEKTPKTVVEETTQINKPRASF
jgi:hypothetical protein